LKSAVHILSGVTVLHEDNHVIAVFKPAGLLTQGDETGDASLLELTKGYLKQKYEKPGNVFLGLVHRLDRPVSGVVVFGRTSKAASRLSEQFRSRSVEKIYLAWVQGTPKAPSGTLVHYLRPGDKRMEIFDEPKPDTKEASLDFRLLRSEGGISLLEVTLHTGRKHQIRAQLARLGTPILGDTRYGGPRGSGDGIGLVAHLIRFDHPTKQERIEVRAPQSALEREGLRP
jgi:23S rRNA pseudouridine1911/1915/1917 synthase